MKFAIASFLLLASSAQAGGRNNNNNKNDNESETTPTAAAETTPTAAVDQNAGSCMGDDAVQVLNEMNGVDSLNCNANDVKLSTVEAIESSPLTCTPGEIITVELQVHLQSSSNSRRSDIGIWIANDSSSDAKSTGTCSHFWFKTGNNPSAGELPDYDTAAGQDDDGCGDIGKREQFTVPMVNPQAAIQVPCVDSDGDGFVDIDSCVAWKVPGNNGFTSQCVKTDHNTDFDYRVGTVPGTKSKCRCEKVNTVSVSKTLCL